MRLLSVYTVQSRLRIKVKFKSIDLKLRRDGTYKTLIDHTSTYSTWSKINSIDFTKVYTIKGIQQKELKSIIFNTETQKRREAIKVHS